MISILVSDLQKTSIAAVSSSGVILELGYHRLKRFSIPHCKTVQNWLHIWYGLEQGWLKNWIGRLLRFFGNLKPAKISKNDTNIICLSSKNTLIFKITRTRLKNWALHAHFNFEIQFVINRSILELKTSSSGFKLLRYRVKNVVFTAKPSL